MDVFFIYFFIWGRLFSFLFKDVLEYGAATATARRGERKATEPELYVQTHSHQVSTLTSGCILITLQIILPGNTVISTPGGAVILLFWFPNKGEKRSWSSHLRCFHKHWNRYFLHDYINKQISTGDLLHSLPNCPASSGPCCSCFRGFQSIIPSDSWTTCSFTHPPCLCCYNIFDPCLWLQAKIIEEKIVLLGCRYSAALYIIIMELPLMIHHRFSVGW